MIGSLIINCFKDITALDSLTKVLSQNNNTVLITNPRSSVKCYIHVI